MIPWEAVRKVYKEDGYYKLLLDVSIVEASNFTKRHLKGSGYAFGYNWITPKITREEVKTYIAPHLYVKVKLDIKDIRNNDWDAHLKL